MSLLFMSIKHKIWYSYNFDWLKWIRIWTNKEDPGGSGSEKINTTHVVVCSDQWVWVCEEEKIIWSQRDTSEISQIKMFNPNWTYRKIIHTWTLNIKIWVIYLSNGIHGRLMDVRESYSWLNPTRSPLHLPIFSLLSSDIFKIIAYTQ